MYDTRFSSHKKLPQHQTQKMLMPATPNFYDYNLSGKTLLNSYNGGSFTSKLPFVRDYKLKQRDKYAPSYNSPPPLATQQAIAMMEFEMGNNLLRASNSGSSCNSDYYLKPRMIANNNHDKKRFVVFVSCRDKMFKWFFIVILWFLKIF